LDELGNARGKFIHIQHVGDLGGDFTHQIQLLQAELLHFGAMRCEQADRNDLGETLNRFSSSVKKQVPSGG
jgi:hypothetical protein